MNETNNLSPASRAIISSFIRLYENRNLKTVVEIELALEACLNAVRKDKVELLARGVIENNVFEEEGE